MSAKLSVIIPVYNAEKFIRTCIESVLNQSFHDFEIIAVNDGSTDMSLDILLEYAKSDSRLKVISKENEGVVLTRKFGVDNALAPYIYQLDADDYIEQTLLEEVYDQLVRTDADMLLFNFEVCDVNTTKSRPYDKTVFSNIDFLKYIWEGKGYYAIWTYAYKKSLVSNVSYCKDLTIGEDAYLTSQLAYFSKRIVFYDSKPLLHYVIHDASMSNGLLNKKQINDILLYPRLIKEFMITKPEYKEVEMYIAGLTIISNNILLSRCCFDQVVLRSKESVRILKCYPDLAKVKSIKRMRKLFTSFDKSYLLGLIFVAYYRIKGKISPLAKH